MQEDASMEKDTIKPERKFAGSDILKLVIGTIVVDYIVEALSRHSPLDAAMFFVEHPLVTACNCMIILAVLSLSLLFRKRVFAMCMFSLIWIALGITNCVVLANRMTPFNVKDLSNLKEGSQIMRNYFSVTNLVIIGLGAAAFALAVILLYRKTSKMETKVSFKKAIPAVAIIIALAFGSVQLGMKAGILDTAKDSITASISDLGAVSEENAASNQQVSASITDIANAISDIASNSEATHDSAADLDETVAYFK